MRGLNVVVPVDGMASVEAFAEQYVAWHMTHAPIISPKVTLTRTGMIKSSVKNADHPGRRIADGCRFLWMFALNQAHKMLIQRNRSLKL